MNDSNYTEGNSDSHMEAEHSSAFDVDFLAFINALDIKEFKSKLFEIYCDAPSNEEFYHLNFSFTDEQKLLDFKQFLNSHQNYLNKLNELEKLHASNFEWIQSLRIKNRIKRFLGLYKPLKSQIYENVFENKEECISIIDKLCPNNIHLGKKKTELIDQIKKSDHSIFKNDFLIFIADLSLMDFKKLLVNLFQKGYPIENNVRYTPQVLNNNEILLLRKLIGEHQRIIEKLNEMEALLNTDFKLIRSMSIKSRLERLMGLYVDKPIIRETYVFKTKEHYILLLDKLSRINHQPVNNSGKTEILINDSSLRKERINSLIASLIVPQIKTKPLVSIVIINKDGVNHLINLFTDFKKNTCYSNYEIIVVDNGSIDGSINYLEEQENKLNLKIIKNDKNVSFSRANNEAVKLAQGELLVFLNNDVQTSQGWLTHLVFHYQSQKNAGAIGARLIYPEKENFNKSLKIQHGGIAFKYEEGFIRPVNMDNGDDLFSYPWPIVEEKIAVTAACVMVKKELFESVGGFDEDYLYGFEDVDLSLKINKLGKTNYIVNSCLLFHYEFGSQEKDVEEEVVQRRLSNKNIFRKKWEKELYSRYWNEKINGCKRLYTGKGLHICFVVTESFPETTAGDFFTAKEFGHSLVKAGYQVSFIGVGNDSDNKTISGSVDVLISMIDGYDVSRLQGNKNIIKIAWIRNWIDRWAKQLYIRGFDIILVSSSQAQEHLEKKYSIRAEIFYLGTNADIFNLETKQKFKDSTYENDICFTGSYWNSPRDIMSFFNPDHFTNRKVSVYGCNWDKTDKFKGISRGFIVYDDIPYVYANAKILIDDANHVTREWGAVNSRVFDALASGVLVVTNGIVGSNSLFGGLLPTFSSEDELTRLLNYYLDNSEECNNLTDQLQKNVLENHTYEKRRCEFQQILSKHFESTFINIKLPAPNWQEANFWGDYHLAKGLKSEFENNGYKTNFHVSDDWNKGGPSDINFIIRGYFKFSLPDYQKNILWNISHPDKVEDAEFTCSDYNFVASTIKLKELQSKGIAKIDFLGQFYDKNFFFPDPQEDEKYQSDILFVGNPRNVFRPILKDLLESFNNSYTLKVYGSGWENFIDKKYIAGKYIENEELRKYYSSTKILLNDHWGLMAQEGYVSNRIFDALACQTFVISDMNKGYEQLFDGNEFYVYKNKYDLKDKIDYFLNHEMERKAIAEKGYFKVKDNYTSENGAKKVLFAIKNLM